MEFDFKIILYIVLFVIYILAKTLKKSPSKQSPKKPRPKIDTEAHEAEPTITFEDMFRELTSSKKKDQPKPVEVIKEVKEFDSEYPSDDEIQDVYKESVRQADKSKTLGEIMREKAKKKRPPVEEFERFSAYDIEERFTLASELGEMLKNPEDARRAIVLREILDRKF